MLSWILVGAGDVQHLALLLGGGQFRLDLRLGSAQYIFDDALAGIRAIARRVAAFPASVFSLTDVSFAVGAAF